ncbi:MAG: NUDIX hydrolase [Natronincolaceae bacterium]|nr:NUDIX hydrolase [Bacillota bacterium]
MIVEEKTVKSERIYEGKIINIRVDTVELPHKKYSRREIVEHPGAVGIIPITPDKDIILVEQFRKPVEEILLEIPAGLIEHGEEPCQCAVRELKEETGYTAGKLKKLSEYYSTPGFSDEKIHIYLAEELVEGIAQPDENEYVEIVKMPINEALEKVRTGEIRDAKTVVAILAYFNFCSRNP